MNCIGLTLKLLHLFTLTKKVYNAEKVQIEEKVKYAILGRCDRLKKTFT